MSLVEALYTSNPHENYWITRFKLRTRATCPCETFVCMCVCVCASLSVVNHGQTLGCHWRTSSDSWSNEMPISRSDELPWSTPHHHHNHRTHGPGHELFPLREALKRPSNHLPTFSGASQFAHAPAGVHHIKAEYVQRAFTGLRDLPTHIPKRIALPRLPLTSYSFFWPLRAPRAPTSPRSIGFCVIWDCISSSSSNSHFYFCFFEMSATMRLDLDISIVPIRICHVLKGHHVQWKPIQSTQIKAPCRIYLEQITPRKQIVGANNSSKTNFWSK